MFIFFSLMKKYEENVLQLEILYGKTRYEVICFFLKNISTNVYIWSTKMAFSTPQTCFKESLLHTFANIFRKKQKSCLHSLSSGGGWKQSQKTDSCKSNFYYFYNRRLEKIFSDITLKAAKVIEMWQCIYLLKYCYAAAQSNILGGLQTI